MEKENIEYIVLDEIKENEVPQELENQEQQKLPENPATIRKYTKLSRPPERFSPSLYYLLMTHSSERECYEEAMQVENKNKWKQGMDEEMESLVTNHTCDLVKFPAEKKGIVE